MNVRVDQDAQFAHELASASLQSAAYNESARPSDKNLQYSKNIIHLFKCLRTFKCVIKKGARKFL